MQSELKPCPFCGSDRLMVLPPTCDRNTPYSAADRAYPVVRCSGCYTDVPGKDFDASSKSAVEAWNRRAALSDQERALDWRPVVEGGRDIQAITEFGTYTISIDSSFAGGTHYLWMPYQREYDDEHQSEHRGLTAAKAAAQADYEQRIRSALAATRSASATSPNGGDHAGEN